MNKVISLLAIISFVAMSACDSGGSGGNDSNGGGGGNIGPASENLTDDQIDRAGDLNRAVKKSDNQVSQAKPKMRNANTLRTAARAAGPQISEQNCRIQMKSPLITYDSDSDKMPEMVIPSDPMQAFNGETRYEVSGANCPIYSLQVHNMTAKEDQTSGKMTMSGTVTQEMRPNTSAVSSEPGFSEMKMNGKMNTVGDKKSSQSQIEMSGHFSSQAEGKVLFWAKEDKTNTKNDRGLKVKIEKGHYKQKFKDFTLELFTERKTEDNRILEEKYILNGKEISRKEYETLMGESDRAANNDGFGDTPNGPQNPDQEDLIDDTDTNGEDRTPIMCHILSPSRELAGSNCVDFSFDSDSYFTQYGDYELTLEVAKSNSSSYKLTFRADARPGTSGLASAGTTRTLDSSKTEQVRLANNFFATCSPTPRCN